MKEINPDKKIIFITDRIPLVFQQALYLREQTSLTVGEFCGQNKELSDSQYDLDVLVFTADFLINKLHNKSLHIADCCCLIIGNFIFSEFKNLYSILICISTKIDEIHHIIKGEHSFKRLLDRFYYEIKPELRPRLLGLSASPSSGLTDSLINDDIQKICTLIAGFIYMPIVYSEDLKMNVNKPELQFIETEVNSDDLKFINLINEFIRPIISKMNSSSKSFNLVLNSNIQDLKFLAKNIKFKSNIEKDLEQFAIASFLDLIINSVDLLTILGAKFAAEFIQNILTREITNNQKNKIWSNRDISEMKLFSEKIKNYSGHSEKLKALVNLLKQDKNLNSDKRTLIFVRRRKTARILLDFLNNDQAIRENYNPKLFVGHVIIELMLNFNFQFSFFFKLKRQMELLKEWTGLMNNNLLLNALEEEIAD
jgi:ERCC4-related helicase